MLKLIWSERAQNNLRNIFDYIAVDNPPAAQSLKRRIDHVIGIAVQLPYAFREGRVAGTREVLATTNYLVVYRVVEDELEIVRVIHTKQRYP